jgi:hypothetical protein
MSLFLTFAILAFATPEAAPQDAGKSDKLICKSTGATGSRVRAAKVCRTRAEWTQLEEAARKRVGQLRDNRRSQPWQ